MTTKKKKNKGGRPSLLDQMDYARMRRLAELGMTDKQIAYVVGVSVDTIDDWKKKKRFLRALSKGKDIADERVKESLFHIALGYTVAEEQLFHYQGKIIRTNILKHYPPSEGAIKMWLSNRQPDIWREKKNGNGDTHVTHIVNNIINNGNVAKMKDALNVLERDMIDGQLPANRTGIQAPETA